MQLQSAQTQPLGTDNWAHIKAKALIIQFNSTAPVASRSRRKRPRAERLTWATWEQPFIQNCTHTKSSEQLLMDRLEEVLSEQEAEAMDQQQVKA